MSAYVLVQVTIHDPEMYEEYKQLTPASIEKYGGRFVIRGGATEVLEGEKNFERCVLLEFDSMDAARTWYNSPEYKAARSIRAQAADGMVLLAEGLG